MLLKIENMMEIIANLVWGLPLVGLLIFSGIFLTFYLGFPQIKHFFNSFRVFFSSEDNSTGKGEINQFQAFCSALSSTLGLGNISGVAIAISVGGPGAIFWMWLAGFIGMATKLTCVTLAVKLRDQNGTEVHGGPMYSLKNGFEKTPFAKVGKFLAAFYAFFIIFSSFGSGNMFQSNQMAVALNSAFNFPQWISGIIFAIAAGSVLLGGIKSIGKFSELTTPMLVVFYFVLCFGIMIYHYDQIPTMFKMIFNDAFNGTSAIGGFTGASVKEILITGIRRAVFSNEAGMGTAAIAHAATKAKAYQQGLSALLEPFIDTIIICSLTAFILLLTGAWTEPLQGADMTTYAFVDVYGELGRYLLVVIILLFAFTTITSWAYYGEQGIVYLFGERYIKPFRFVYLFFVFLGSFLDMKLILNFSDIFFGLLAVPNFFSNIFLSFLVKEELKQAS